MFCRFGSVDERRPVAAIVWLNVVWMRPASSISGSSESTTVFSRATSRWRSRCSSTGWPVCSYRWAERIGIGGVTGLDPLRLGQAELVEQDLLQLLGRAEIERATDDRVRILLDRLDRGAQLGLQCEKLVGIGGDADRLHVGQDERQRQLHLGEQPCGAALLEVGVERVGQIADRRRPNSLDLS